ncbi:MAG: TonB-dependent receptor plug domain-containing protein [Odoribacteraceae bacterium]|jgi:TonB-dependent SusC/RagA subfamily outer membrane receptor|nr:TonB-dependent receptor plug domain-containing protein [Odoribacteraceae bacterium]
MDKRGFLWIVGTFLLLIGAGETRGQVVDGGKGMERADLGNFEREREGFARTSATVRGEELRRMNPNSLAEAIGMFDPSFRVKRESSDPNRALEASARGGGMPLFVLDGREVDARRVFDLEMHRVASVTLLKDAAASAVHGRRGAGGVVVITTAEAGEGERLSYDYRLTTSSPDFSSREEASRKWLETPSRNATGHGHFLLVEGGWSALRVGVSGSYRTGPGVMKGSRRDRMGLDAELSWRVGERLRVRNAFSVERVKGTESPYGTLASYASLSPLYSPTDGAGNAVRVLDTVGMVLNPAFDATLDGYHRSGSRGIGDVLSATWEFLPGARLAGVASFWREKGREELLESPLANRFFFSEPKGSLVTDTTRARRLEGSLVATVERSAGGHAFHVALGVNAWKEKTREVYREMTPLAGSILLLDNEDRQKALFSGVHYAYRDRFLVDLSARVEEMERELALDRATGGAPARSSTDYIKGEYSSWAVGAGWNVHREEFMRSLEVIRHLRLKANVGMIDRGKVDAPARKHDAGVEVSVAGSRFSLAGRLYRSSRREIIRALECKVADKGYEIDAGWKIVEREGLAAELTGKFARHDTRVKLPAGNNGNATRADQEIEYEWEDFGEYISSSSETAPDIEGLLGAHLYCRGFRVGCSLYASLGGEVYNRPLAEGGVTGQRLLVKDNLLELRSLYLSYEFRGPWQVSAGRVAIALNDAWRASSNDVPRGIHYPFARHATLSMQVAF